MALNTIVAAAGVAVVGALCAYFLWPAAAGAAMMKAPGAPGRFISRRAFEANPKLYFQLLRLAGADAARAAFAAYMPPICLVCGVVWLFACIWSLAM